MLLGFTFNLSKIKNSNKDQFVDHPTTLKILVKLYFQQSAQVTILRWLVRALLVPKPTTSSTSTA
jgi:hypothetical protein